jgi:hypothetical protein
MLYFRDTHWIWGVLKAVTMKNTFFQYVTPWSSVAVRQRFARMYCLYTWGRKCVNRLEANRKAALLLSSLLPKLLHRAWHPQETGFQWNCQTRSQMEGQYWPNPFLGVGTHSARSSSAIPMEWSQTSAVWLCVETDVSEWGHCNHRHQILCFDFSEHIEPCKCKRCNWLEQLGF